MSPHWSPYDCRRCTARSRRGGRGQLTRRGTRPVLGEVLNPAYLDRVQRAMAVENGQAPGVDGVRNGDLSTGERFQLFRDLGAAILAGTFRPQPLRDVDIPKADGSKRTLKLAVVRDRTLSKAVADTLAPLAERVFSTASYGFRPKRDRFQLLADLKVFCETNDVWVITPADVKKAFDNVPVGKAILAIRRLESLGADPELINLAITLIKGHTPQEVSIPQGNSLSPMILNLVLHDALDTTMTVACGGHDPVGYWRYADDLAIATHTAAEGREQLDRIRAVLAGVGLKLKSDHGEHPDLTSGEPLNLLGMRLTRTGTTLTFDIPHKKWDDLQAKLVAAHQEANPTAAAKRLVEGWVEAFAPAFGTDERKNEEYTGRLVNLLRRTGHRNSLTRAQIARTVRMAANRWERTVTDARNRMTAELPANPRTTTGTTVHTDTATPDARRDRPDGTITEATTDHTAQNSMGERAGAVPEVCTESASPPISLPLNASRPSGRSTALSDRIAVPLSAPHRRARTVVARVDRHRTGLRRDPGSWARRARPPPRPP